MNIMELGAIGELVGGVAVLITLIYLALQVRHTAESGRVAATSAVHNNFHSAVNLLFREAEATIAPKAMDGLDDLSPIERYRWGAQLYTMYCHFESVYYRGKRDLLEPDEYDRAMALLGWFHTAPGVQAWWNGNPYDDRPNRTAELFSQEFQAFVDGLELGSWPAQPEEA